MEAIAKLRYVRISPRKVKIVLDLIRGRKIGEAFAILNNLPKAACECLRKLLKSAAANAENNLNMSVEELYVSSCFVTPGPILKRNRAVSKGRSCRILKRTSHVTIKLSEIEEKKGGK